MPYTRILVHVVWATKVRKKLLTTKNRHRLFVHIRDYSSSKDIHLLEINGFTDHVHCLISVSPNQNIASIVQLLKGESSFWANKHLEFPEKFSWQNDYFAVSVSQSHEAVVRNYIRNQEFHHSKKSFEEEYQAFIAKYGFSE
jgi:REP element-mobilizing transposase RayT